MPSTGRRKLSGNVSRNHWAEVGAGTVRYLEPEEKDGTLFAAYGYAVVFWVLLAASAVPGARLWRRGDGRVDCIDQALYLPHEEWAEDAERREEAGVSGGFRHRLEEGPSRVRALGGSISFFSVGLALLAVLLVGQHVGGLLAWPLGSFAATLVFLLVFALEIGLAVLVGGRRVGTEPRPPSERPQTS